MRPPTINATVSALRFFFNVTVDRPDVTRPLTSVAEPRKIPVVLNPDEVVRFLEAAPGPKYKAAFGAAYAPPHSSNKRTSKVVAPIRVRGSIAVPFVRAMSLSMPPENSDTSAGLVASAGWPEFAGEPDIPQAPISLGIKFARLLPVQPASPCDRQLAEFGPVSLIMARLRCRGSLLAASQLIPRVV